MEDRKKIAVQQTKKCLISKPEKKATECLEERSVEEIKSSEKYLESESE